MILRITLLITFVCAISGVGWADESRDAALVDALLKLSAPIPDWREQLKRPDAPHEDPPAPDAPIEVLVDFWLHAPDGLEPDPSAPPRLLSWGETHPETLGDLLHWIPADVPEYHDRLKALVDRSLRRVRTERKWVDSINTVADWLERYSRYYRAEFIEGLRKAFSGTDGERIGRDIQALGKLDRKAAEKLLLQLSRSRDAFTRTAALAWLHELQLSGPDDPRLLRWRGALQRTATDPSAPIRARDYAVLGLMRVRWDGQEEWFTGLFSDATLGAYQNQNQGVLLRPLVGVVREDPDRWVPKIVPLVASSNQAIHNNAVRCLAEFARADAVAALLPWVADPHWAELGSETPRLEVVERTRRFNLPGSVPGLLKISEHENDEILAAAAQGLEHYHATEAASTLKAAAERASEDWSKESIIRAAATLGAYSGDEMEQAIAAFVKHLGTHEGQSEREEFNLIFDREPLDPEVRLGSVLWHEPIENDELTTRLLRRAEAAAAGDPQSAERFRIIVAGWRGEAADAAIALRLQAGDLTAPWVAQLLAHRETLGTPVGRIEGLRGVSRGVQAAVSGAEASVAGVLGGEDRWARLGLLACARHIRLPLPLEAVEPLLDANDPELARAAEAYLTGEGSHRARAAILRRHPGEARVLGTRMDYPYDPNGESAGPIADTEELLRKMVLEDDGPREILALLSEGFGGNAGQRMVLVYADKAILRWLDDGGRRRERVISPEELGWLRSWLDAHRVDDLADFDAQAADGIQYEYVRVTRDGGRRIYMNNPPGGARYPGVFMVGPNDEPDPLIYGRLVDQFDTISSPPMEITYDSLRDAAGFRIVHAREQGKALALAHENGKLLIQASDGQFSDWHVLSEKGLSPATAATPSAYVENKFGHRSEFLDADWTVAGPCTGRLAGQYVWSGSRQSDDVEGLWMATPKTKPQALAKGNYGLPVPTPDGEWIVAAKTGGTDWSFPNGVVRLHVRDRREYAVDIPPADRFGAIAWLPAQQKILLHREKDAPAPGIEPKAGPDEPEFYLLDASTGAFNKITGEFRPFLDGTWRQRQPTGRPHEIWAALPTSEIGIPATIVGRYDTRDFKFLPALTVFGLTFASSDMWVDEHAHTVTFLGNGDVLRLALP